jgi:hypothetical protein
MLIIKKETLLSVAVSTISKTFHAQVPIILAGTAITLPLTVDLAEVVSSHGHCRGKHIVVTLHGEESLKEIIL